jgi:hypothetical protein
MATTKARRAFNESAADVERLLAIHAAIGGTGPGRRYQLEVLNKSAVVLITAIWEAFCEDLAAEALDHIVDNVDAADELPLNLRKAIAVRLKKAPHELAVWDLADDGWKAVIRGRLAELTSERNWNMNTPKSDKVDQLFTDAIGLASISDAWKWPKMTPEHARKKLDGYVSLRGAIAHRGKSATTCRKVQVNDYFKHVKRLAGRTGTRVRAFVRATTGKRLA